MAVVHVEVVDRRGRKSHSYSHVEGSIRDLAEQALGAEWDQDAFLIELSKNGRDWQLAETAEVAFPPIHQAFGYSHLRFTHTTQRAGRGPRTRRAILCLTAFSVLWFAAIAVGFVGLRSRSSTASSSPPLKGQVQIEHFEGECWWECKQAGGPCGYCGRDGVCCRQNWNDHPACYGRGCHAKHCCAISTSAVSYLRKAKVREGVHYLADYNVTAVASGDASAPPEYRYPEVDRAFSYPDHVEGVLLSHSPKVYYFEGFLSDSECDALIEAAKGSLSRSMVLSSNDSRRSEEADFRTSSQTWLTDKVPVQKEVSRRIFAVTGWEGSMSEEMQILRYTKGQQYAPHLDYFDPATYGKQQSHRAVTCFLYLSTAKGGATAFPRAHGGTGTTCGKGLQVLPRKGNMACFYSMLPNGSLDPRSLHGGCPVEEGVKWAGTKWLRVRDRS